MTEVILTYGAALILALPLGWYLARVFSPSPTLLDRLFAPVELPFYRLAGVDRQFLMSWKQYGRSLLGLHLVIALLAYGVLLFQGHLPLNPDGIKGMRWDLALHTTASFITNTDQQHYAGQAQLSYFSQMFAIVAMQVVTPSAGIAVLVAILRAVFLPREGLPTVAGREVGLGNFYADLVRAMVRVVLPLAFGTALLLAWQGVPTTFAGAQVVHPLDATAGLAEQRIPVGPVAPMVAIKQVGTNGGGWYGANSAVPLENPTPLSNYVETVAIALLPLALVFMLGFLTARWRLAVSILAVMLVLAAALTSLAVWSETQPNAAFAGLAARGPNLEGKEVRVGATASALWAGLTTQTSNGSVDASIDSFNPAGVAATLMAMFINAIFGGAGVGLINYLLFFLLAAFLGSLMVGRTPELYGRALETHEIKLISLTLLLQPILVLGLTAVAVAVPGLAGNSNPGYHGFSEVLYEYTSAFANNGSGMAGLHNDTLWWNLSCAPLLVLGRFIPILVPLAVAARLAAKRVAPTTSGSLDVETPTFALLTLGVVVMFALLSFLPVLALGPLADALSAGG